MEKSITNQCHKLRQPWLLGLIVVFLLLFSWIFQLHSLRDAVTMLPVTTFTLELNWVYLLFSPFFNTLDTLSFLSSSQHLSLILWLLILPTLCTLYSALKQQLPWLKLVLKVLKTLLLSVLCLLFLYATAVLMPRAMGALHAQDKDVLLVDFHSHTNHSWDANHFFTAEHNRLWHQKAGFDVAFITDHQSFLGAEQGKKDNPASAQDGVMLLSGLEEVYQGVHVMALCADSSIYEVSKTGCKPLFVQANPSDIERLAITHADGQGVLAIEIHDAAPVGLEEIKNRDRWLEQAKKFNIAVVYGSDNHGWAFAASAWSALLIPGWQTMSADALEHAITQHIRDAGFTAVQVIERHMVEPATSWLGHITMPIQLFWRILCNLSMAERLSWLLWCCCLLALYDRKNIRQYIARC